ncbi:hypothetical protein [Natronolimnohabitans innermongolicus]|uniref:hypothetical protein n=1 Tax=Natronolimnohabitans innermongolicus TaxID=253107 RepID=UPI000677F94F|nr:hypothetical protein [Natronolimnohabitans innermongolicus]
MDEVFSEITDQITSKFWDEIGSWRQSGGWRTVIDNLREIYDLVASSASDAIRAIDDALEPVEFILDNTSAIVDAIGDEAEEIREELEEEDEDAEASIGRATPSAGSGATARRSETTGAGGATRSFHSSVTEEIGDAVDELTDVAGDLVSFVDQLSEDLREEFNSYWNDVQSFVSDLESGIRDLIEPAVEEFVDLIANPIDRFSDVWESAVSSADGIPSVDLSYDVLDIDLGVSVDPLADGTNTDSTFDATAAAGAGSASGRARTRSTGAGTGTGTGSAGSPSGPFPIEPEMLTLDNCPRAPSDTPVYAMGLEFSMFDVPVVGLDDLSFTPYLGFSWAPCFFYGAEADTEVGVDITSLYEALVLFQDSWATVASEIESGAEARIEEFEEATTLGDFREAAMHTEAFVDSMEERLEPHGIPLSLLMDELSPEVDLLELVQIAGTLEESVVDTIDQFVDSDVAEAIVELDDTINAIHLAEDVPGIDDIGDVGGDLAEASTREEVREIEVGDLLRLHRGYRRFSSWLEDLDAEQRKRLEAETGVDIETIERHLDLVTSVTIDVGGWINTVADDLVTDILEKLKEKAAELTERTYDLAEEWDGFKCRSQCIDPSRLKRAVATMAVLNIVVGMAVADFIWDHVLTNWLPSAISWIGRWITRILFVLVMIAVALAVYIAVFVVGGVGSIGTAAPEAASSVVGVGLLVIAAALVAGHYHLLNQSADAFDVDRRYVDQYTDGSYYV